MGPLGVGAFPDGEWDCFGKMLANEVQYCSSQLLVEDDGNVGMQSMFCSTLDAAGGNKNRFYSIDSNNSNFQYLSQERSHNGNCSGHSVFMANPDLAKYYFDQVLANSTSMSFCMMDDKNSGSCVQSHIVMKDERRDKSESFYHSQVELIVSPAKHFKLKRKLDVRQLKVQLEDKINSHGNCNKKPRVSNDVKHCMKNQKLDKNGNQAEDTNAGSDHGRSSSSYTQEDDNVSHENSIAATSALNSKGKTKATRGSATHPQPLCKEKKRENKWEAKNSTESCPKWNKGRYKYYA